MPALSHAEFIAQAFSVIGCDPDDLLRSTESGYYSPGERLLEIEDTDTFGDGSLLDYLLEDLGHKWKIELSERSESGEPMTALGFLSGSGAVVAVHYADPDIDSPAERLTLEFYPASDEADAASWLEEKASEF